MTGEVRLIPPRSVTDFQNRPLTDAMGERHTVTRLMNRRDTGSKALGPYSWYILVGVTQQHSYLVLVRGTHRPFWTVSHTRPSSVVVRVRVCKARSPDTHGRRVRSPGSVSPRTRGRPRGSPTVRSSDRDLVKGTWGLRRVPPLRQDPEPKLILSLLRGSSP